MKRPVAKKIISIAIMFTLLSGHIFLPLSVNADNEFLNYDNPNASGNNPYKISLSGIVSSGLLTSVVGCTGVVNKVSKVTSTFLSNLLQSKTEKAKRKLQKAQEDLAKKLVEEISGIAIQAAEATPGFPTADPGLRVQIIAKEKADKARAKALEQKLNIDQEAINTAVQRNQEEVAAASFREDCINGIAITLAKNQLTAMTKYTMNWVNTGFNGDPFFIRNVDSFITSIEDKILTEEINLFKNPENTTDLPYGRIFAQGAILENQSEKNFTNSMKQDLTSYLVPRATLNSFENDFSEGGWDGWFALTQRDPNNPLGFVSKKAQNLVERQASEVQNTKDELTQSGGYLSQKRCVEWAKIDPDDNSDIYQNSDGSPKCLIYETVTPGSAIRDKVSTYLNSPERQLELAKTLNDALNALFSALVNKFENQGLSSLRSSANNFSSTTSGGFGVNQVFDTLGNSILVSNSSTIGSSATEGPFDITRDLGNRYTVATNGKLTISKKGVFQTQFDYVNKLNDSKTVLMNILPALGKLDYCIPGPNTNWRTNSIDTLSSYIDGVGNGGQVVIDPSLLESNLDDYEARVNTTYGANSLMQNYSPNNTSHLKMSSLGLTLTKDIGIYADTINEVQDDYKEALLESDTNIKELDVIKGKVNVIIAAAQARRTAKRAQAGLPAIKSVCLTAEKVTYMENGVIK